MFGIERVTKRLAPGLFGLVLLLVFSGATPHSDDTVAAPSDIQILKPTTKISGRMIMNLICDGRTDSALVLLNDPSFAPPGEPMTLLLRSRALRDQLEDEDKIKTQIKIDSEPIHALLDQVIDICSRVIDSDSADPAYLFYRGRAHMGKAQLHTLTRSFWAAGRAAGRAKKDLERYLKVFPDDPDANGELGAFLYFADAIPGVAKLFSKLLFFPTGDRDRGLKMLHYAATNDGDFTVDYQIAIAASQIIFEGQLEEGTDAMIRLIEKYPYYTRLAEPLGILAPLMPFRIRELQRIEDGAIGRHVERNGSDTNWNLVKRIQLHRSYTDLFFASPARASVAFEDLAHTPPPRPDWVLPIALLNRGFIDALTGQSGRARKAYDLIAQSQSMAFFHDVSASFKKDLETAIPTFLFDEIGFVELIYDGHRDGVEQSLEQYRFTHGEDAIFHFYTGEWNLLGGDLPAAAKAYDAALQLHVSKHYETFQMLAAFRLGEIHGHEKRYDMAAECVGRSLHYAHTGYLIDYAMRSRHNYYKALAKGETRTPPSLAIPHHRNAPIQQSNSN